MMTTLLKSTLLTTAVLLFFASASFAQSPYPSLSFSRDQNNEGTTDYVLKPEVTEIVKKVGGADKPYQLLGVLVRPSKQAAVLMFVNAQKELQLDSQKDKSVLITADAVEIGNLEYELVAKSDEPTDPIKLEMANVLIDWKQFQTITTANSVLLKYGTVVYQLDKDNINALHYLAAEIEKDQTKP